MLKVLGGGELAFQHEGTTARRLLVAEKRRNRRRVKDDIPG